MNLTGLSICVTLNKCTGTPCKKIQLQTHIRRNWCEDAKIIDMNALSYCYTPTTATWAHQSHASGVQFRRLIRLQCRGAMNMVLIDEIGQYHALD